MAFRTIVDSQGNDIKRVSLSMYSSEIDSVDSKQTGSSNSKTLHNTGEYTDSTNTGTLQYMSSAFGSNEFTPNRMHTISSSSDSSFDDESSESLSWNGSTDSNVSASTFDREKAQPDANVNVNELQPLETDSRNTSVTFTKNVETISDTQLDRAFLNWIVNKNKQFHSKMLAAKRKQKEAEEAAEERRRLAAESYEKWLQAKNQKQNTVKKEQKLCTRNENGRNDKATVSSVSSSSTSITSSSSANLCAGKGKDLKKEEAERRIAEWQRNKRKEDERRRNQQRQQEEERRKQEEERKKKSAAAWNKWIANAASKPKPVPLNQGMKSLRGTISNIYINPNEWKSIIADNE